MQTFLFLFESFGFLSWLFLLGCALVGVAFAHGLWAASQAEIENLRSERARLRVELQQRRGTVTGLVPEVAPREPEGAAPAILAAEPSPVPAQPSPSPRPAKSAKSRASRAASKSAHEPGTASLASGEQVPASPAPSRASPRPAKSAKSRSPRSARSSRPAPKDGPPLAPESPAKPAGGPPPSAQTSPHRPESSAPSASAVPSRQDASQSDSKPPRAARKSSLRDDGQLGLLFYLAPEDPDPLERLPAITPAQVRDLNVLGVYKFEQIARWNETNLQAFAVLLGMEPVELQNLDWVRRAKALHGEIHGSKMVLAA